MVQENFNFWFEAFRSAPLVSENQNPDTIHFLEAFALAVETVQPGRKISIGDIEIWFRACKFDVEELKHLGRNKHWFEDVLKEFKKQELPEKGGFDLVAVAYEFAGILFPEHGSLPSFLSESIWNAAKNYRLLYPAASLAAVNASQDEFSWKNSKNAIEEKVKRNVSNGVKLIARSAEATKMETIDEITAKASELRQGITSTLDQTKEEMIATAKEEIDRYKKEVGATLVVNGAHTLWSKKATAHRWFFGICAFLFVTVMGAAIFSVAWFWSQISAAILILEPLFKGHVFGGIIVLLIPVLGVAWFLRLLSRFTIQNMMLADDAQLRRVMAETYVKLVSEGAIKDPEDRAIILSALFRPLPGSNTEDVSPPSITDILKAK